MKRQIDAVIFDMDGVLIDSEPLWHEAEIAAFGAHGLVLTSTDCAQTTGMRIDVVVGHWQLLRPDVLGGIDPGVLVGAIVDGVVARIAARGEAMPHAIDAIGAVVRRDRKLGLASSSPPAVIDAVLLRLGIREAFSDIRSGWWLPRAKPDPRIYVEACAALGVLPARALAIEDSESGLRAAIDAGMVVCALPDRRQPVPASVVRAQFVLSGLHELDGVITTLDARAVDVGA